MLWLARTSLHGGYLDTSDCNNVKLTTAWMIAAYFIKNGALVNSLFGIFLAVLSTAVTVVADIYTRKRDIAIITILCVIGIAAATFALIQVSGGTALAELTYYGELAAEPPATVEGMIRGFFGGLIGWFGTFLAAVLGLSLVLDNGVLKALFGPSPTDPPSGPDHEAVQP